MANTETIAALNSARRKVQDSARSAQDETVILNTVANYIMQDAEICEYVTRCTSQLENPFPKSDESETNILAMLLFILDPTLEKKNGHTSDSVTAFAYNAEKFIELLDKIKDYNLDLNKETQLCIDVAYMVAYTRLGDQEQGKKHLDAARGIEELTPDVMPDIRNYHWIYDILTTLYNNNTSTQNMTGLTNGIVRESLVRLKLYA